VGAWVGASAKGNIDPLGATRGRSSSSDGGHPGIAWSVPEQKLQHAAAANEAAQRLKRPFAEDAAGT
jgi:hypothetical protein